METIKLSLDFLAGPVWKKYSDPDTHEAHTGVPIVDDDEIVKALDEEIQEMYSSYYEFNSHDQACWINGEKELEEAPRMLELIKKLKARLDEINDGSYVVEDLLSWQYELMLEESEVSNESKNGKRNN